MSNKPVKLPKLADLTTDVDQAYKSDELNLLLNQEPPKSWVKLHPYVKGHLYIPIDKVELMLRRIFKQYKIEVTGQGTAFNGVWVTVRVHYVHPVTNQWLYHDGIGAIQLQMRGKTPEEKKNGQQVPFQPENINNGALSMAFPHAETLAIKDACDKFGRLFGADLNRDDVIPYETDPNLRPESNYLEGEDLETAKEAVKSGRISIERLSDLWDISDEAMSELKEAENAKS